MRFRVFGPYFEVPRLGHYKSTFLSRRSKIGVQKQGAKSVKWWFLYLNLHKATLKGLGTAFGPILRHFKQNKTNSKSAILLGPFRGGSSRFSLSETPKQGFEEGRSAWGIISNIYMLINILHQTFCLVLYKIFY